MLGTGKGFGFSLKPDFGRYGFLGVWNTEMEADDFLANSAFMKQDAQHAEQITTAKLIPVKAKGAWSGQNPFTPLFQPPEDEHRIAVLTRASIRMHSLRRFWQHVPSTSDELEQAGGLRYSIGLGEGPFKLQATFSIWESEPAMNDFAYNSTTHKSVIQKTRSEGWYAEDLCARFLVLEDFI